MLVCKQINSKVGPLVSLFSPSCTVSDNREGKEEGEGGRVIQQIGGRIECVLRYRSTLDRQDVLRDYVKGETIYDGGIAPRIPDI